MITMELRQKELLDLKSFTENVETEVTMLLQSLQWDRKRLLEGDSTAICQYDENHRMPKDSLQAHESSCVLRSLGYTETDELLPAPPADGAHTLVKFSNNQIQRIISEAANVDPLFKTVIRVQNLYFNWLGRVGSGGVSHQPLSLSRLQLVYTADERRALHDAVVAAVPSCHDLGDLALASSNEDDKQGNVVKSRVEILAELRNMKRRRTKYRVAAKTKNYSDVLRDVIKTQMESYGEAVSSTLPTKAEKLLSKSRDSELIKCHDKSNSSTNNDEKRDSRKLRDNKRDRREVSVTRKGTNVGQYDEIRHREEKIRKETNIKQYENRHDRSDSSKRHDRHRDRNIDREHNVEKSKERYRSNTDHNERRRSGSSHKHKSGMDEENGNRGGSIDERNKSDRRKTHDYEDRHADRRYYKNDKHCREKIKEEPKDQSIESNSRHSHQSDRRRARSRSRDRHRDRSRKRKHFEDDRKYGEQSEGILFKRYYDVKKEEP